MALSKSQRSALDALLAKGDTLGATKLLAGVAGFELPEEHAEPVPEPVKIPRKPEEVILDLFKGIHSLLGNSPALVPLIAELSELLQPPAAPAPAPATE